MDTPSNHDIWKPLLLLVVGWLLSAAHLLAFLWELWPRSAWAPVVYSLNVVLFILVSFLCAVPTIPKSKKPFMQALWHIGLVGAVPAVTAFVLLSYLHSLSAAFVDYLESVALCLSAMVLLALWVGAADSVGSLGLQPLKEAGWQTWTPPAFLLTTIICLLIVYNLTHIIGTVEQSVEQVLPPSLQVTYWVLVALWVTSFVRVLVTRPGQPGDAAEEYRSNSRNLLFCTACKARKPHRCRHCTKCSTCVLRMDHHCPWLRQCIGFGNYKFFLTFIVYSAVALVFKAVTMLLFMVKAFQIDVSFCTRLWLLSAEILIIALGGTMLAFSGFHLFLVAQGMTTIEYLTRNEKSDKKLVFDQGLVGNVQAALGSNPLCWFLPACPPSGDGCTFPYSELRQEDAKLSQAMKRDLAMSGTEDLHHSLQASKVTDPVASNRVSQPCIESTAEPTCIEQQQVESLEASTRTVQSTHDQQYKLLLQGLQRKVEEAKNSWHEQQLRMQVSAQEEYELHKKIVASDEQTKSFKDALEKLWQQMEGVQQVVVQTQSILEARSQGNWSVEDPSEEPAAAFARQHMETEMQRHIEVREQIKLCNAQLREADNAMAEQHAYASRLEQFIQKISGGGGRYVLPTALKREAQRHLKMASVLRASAARDMLDRQR
ncbi:zdhhc15b [Symbiodinium natans]|uniref:Palmitoyltransferase n=1 Tax=Symbiodinium natans TaxID=878477 RepID=A0A812JE40_9DINO|nr:zdhhc15b [Symbiodinium natans]